MIGSTSRVAGELWQGDARMEDAARFRMLVLTAREVQETPPGYLGVVLREPLTDDGDPENLTRARRLVDAVRSLGKTATIAPMLVACSQGLNRSGLVVGLLLRSIDVSGPDAVRWIRAARGYEALSNPVFEAWVLAPP